MFRVVIYHPDKVGEVTEADFPPEQIDRLVEHLRAASRAARRDSTCLLGVSVFEKADPDNGRTAEIALAQDEWALICFVMDDSFPAEQWLSVGSNEDAEVHVCWDQPTSISRRLFVPALQAERALVQWLESGRLSDALDWTEDAR